jgi:hypothetical protein
MTVPSSDPAQEPDQHDDRRLAPQAPPSILAAFRLMYVGALLQGLGLVFTWLTRDQLRNTVAEQQNVSGEELDSAYNITLGGGITINLLAIAMWLWMAHANRHGFSWARIVATVLGALNIAFTLYWLSQASGLSVVVQLITIAMGATVLFLLYRPDSSAYYTAVAQQARS